MTTVKVVLYLQLYTIQLLYETMFIHCLSSVSQLKPAIETSIPVANSSSFFLQTGSFQLWWQTSSTLTTRKLGWRSLKCAGSRDTLKTSVPIREGGLQQDREIPCGREIWQEPISHYLRIESFWKKDGWDGLRSAGPEIWFVFQLISLNLLRERERERERERGWDQGQLYDRPWHSAIDPSKRYLCYSA